MTTKKEIDDWYNHKAPRNLRAAKGRVKVTRGIDKMNKLEQGIEKIIKRIAGQFLTATKKETKGILELFSEHQKERDEKIIQNLLSKQMAMTAKEVKETLNEVDK